MFQANKLSLKLENELVLATVSLNRLTDARINEILECKLDWSLLLNTSARHGVFPLCCKTLMALSEKKIPSEEYIHWKELYQAYIQNNIRLTWKLVKCVELLSSNGIESIVLKGPAYAIQAYGDPTLRQYTDLDILIHPLDFPKVYDLLVQFGFVPVINLDKQQMRYQLRSGNHFSFIRQGDVFEVHWYIAPLGSSHLFSIKELWEQFNVVQVFDQDLLTLSPEHTILYSCLHGAKHGWKQLKWIVDLAYLSQSVPEDAWLTIFEHAKQKGLFLQICLGLLLTIDLVNAQLPLQIRDQIISNRAAQVLLIQVKGSLFTINSRQSPMDDYKFYMKSLERLQDRLHYILSLIFVPEEADWLTISLPGYLYFIYFFLRPVRLLYKFGKAAFPAIR